MNSSPTLMPIAGGSLLLVGWLAFWPVTTQPLSKPPGQQVKARVHPKSETPLSPAVRKFLGPRILAIVRTANRVEVYRVSPKPDYSVANLAGFPILQRGRDLSKKQIDSLRKTILDERSYIFGKAKFCQCYPEYALRIKAPAGEVLILLGPSSKQWMFLHGNDRLPGRLEDYDSVAPWIHQLFTQLLQPTKVKKDNS